MSKCKGKSSARTSALQVVGVVYNHNKDDRSLRLIDFLQAERDFADRISAKAEEEEEEVERLKAENDQRVEELLAKAKDIKQRRTCESEDQKDTTAVDQSETGNLEKKSKPKLEENWNVVNKTEKPPSKADALEQLRKMEWKRCQEDHKNIVSDLRSSNGRQEFPPLTKSKKDDEYFSGTKVKKNKERKKNREEIVSLKELEKCRSTMPVSEKNSKLAHTILPPSNSCWQNKAGAALFESAKPKAEQDADDVELNWALSESLREQQEQQKRFMEILAGSCVKTNRKPTEVMTFPPPEPAKEEDWDADESHYTDAEESIEGSKTENKCQVEIKGKQRIKGSEAKGVGNTGSKTYTAFATNDKSLGLCDNGEQRNINEVRHFSSAQQHMNKLATNLSEKLQQKEVQSSNINRSYTTPYHIKRGQHDDLENKSKYENGHCMQRVSESLKNKSDTIHRQEYVIKSAKETTPRESLNHGNTSHVYRNIHDIPPASIKIRKDSDLSPKLLPLEHSSEQKHISQFDVKSDISQSLSALHIETGPMRSWEEGEFTHQNSAVANEVQSGSHEASLLLPNKVPYFQAKTQESGAANMQHLTQGREQLSGSSVSQGICPPFSAQEVNASTEHYQQQKQPLSSQSAPGQSVSPDSYASLMEELQRIRIYQNFLMQLSAQESLQVAMQQQLQSINALGTSGSGLTQEQLQTMFQVQHQHTLMPDVKALLQQQTQSPPVYAPVANMLQPQYPGAALPNPKDASEHSQTPSISPGSPDNVSTVQKHFQGVLQQHQQNPSVGVTDKERTQQQQWGGMAQPGTQTSATVHLSLQTSYPNAPQSGFVGPTQYSQPMLMQQQYAPNMHVAKPPSPQSLTGVPSNMNPTTTNAAMSAVEATQYPQSMLLQYAPNTHVAKPPSPQSHTGTLPNMSPTATNIAMSAVKATQYPQSMLLQQQYATNMLASPPSPQSVTGMPSNMNSPATNVALSAVDATQYNMRAQLMTAGMYNQQPTQHAMAGLVPLVSQEKPKSKGRGRLLRQMNDMA